MQLVAQLHTSSIPPHTHLYGLFLKPPTPHRDGTLAILSKIFLWPLLLKYLYS